MSSMDQRVLITRKQLLVALFKSGLAKQEDSIGLRYSLLLGNLEFNQLKSFLLSPLNCLALKHLNAEAASLLVSSLLRLKGAI